MRALLVSLAAAAVLCAPVRTRAQDEVPTPPVDALFERGVERLRAGDHAAAAAAFRESYRLVPRVTTMCNLALTYDRWGPEHRAQAVRAYRTCARDDDTGRFRAFAERRIAEVERELVLLEGEGDGVPEDDARPGGAPDETRRDETGRDDASQDDASQDSASQDSASQDSASQDDALLAQRRARREHPREAAPDHGLLYAGIATGALAAGATIAGVVLALDAQSAVDALRNELGPTPVVVRDSPQHERLESARTSATAATALYVTAGVLAAAAATFVVIELVQAGEHERSVAVSFGPSAVEVSGTF